MAAAVAAVVQWTTETFIRMETIECIHTIEMGVEIIVHEAEIKICEMTFDEVSERLNNQFAFVCSIFSWY